MFRRVVQVACLALIVAVLAPAAVVAADPSSDIPGIPLPSPVVMGSLGGPIYDVVYRLDVPPGNVIVASLSGTAGTDFDMYLFNSAATTVVSNEGVVAMSAGPTSTEHLSYATQTGGAYYIDLNGATNVEGTYTLTVQFVPDRTPPAILSVLIDDGSVVTNDPNVTVKVFAVDDLSGVASIALSSDGITWSDWLPYTGINDWYVGGPDGRKTVWARVRNGVGLISSISTAWVDLDRTPPSVVSIDPSSGSTVTTTTPTIAVKFDEGIAPRSWAVDGLIVQASDGSRIPGSLTYDGSRDTGYFRPIAPLTYGTTYALGLGQITDLAGNQLAVQPSWTVRVMRSSGIRLTLDRTVAPYGATVALSGVVATPPGSSIVVSRYSTGAGNVLPLAIVTPADGRFTLRVAAAANSIFEAAYAGDASTAPASAQVRLVVRRLVAILGASSTVTRTASAGRSIPVVASINPGASGVVVSFRLYRFDPLRGTWSFAGSRGARTRTDGTASVLWTPAPGLWGWRAIVYPTRDYANNISPLVRWRVGG